MNSANIPVLTQAGAIMANGKGCGCCSARDAVAVVYRVWCASEEEAERYLQRMAEVREMIRCEEIRAARHLSSDMEGKG